ncbi:MAG TPA: hypothetical protein VMI73_22985, partial [Trebonia sp.]|nr:hypothetical protein [Trebonia sp.]
RSSAVSLPELPLLGVLPGTGGLTRVVDKRHVRRDLADYFSTRSEGVGGKKAVAWKLVDEAVPRVRNRHVSAHLDRDRAVAEITVTGPSADAPRSIDEAYAHRGKIAAWVAPPRNGINGQPFDYDYVHLA